MGKRIQELTGQDLEATGLSPQEAQLILYQLTDVLRQDDPPEQVWRAVSKLVLLPDHPFELHKVLLEASYEGKWDQAQQGSAPVWVPTPGGAAFTNVAGFMNRFQGCPEWERMRTGDPMKDLALLQRLSVDCPEAYWPPVLQELGIRFHQQPRTMLQLGDTADTCQWLPDARLNIAECALSGADPDAPAVLYASEAQPEEIRCINYGQLSRRAYRFASALQASGLTPGSSVGLVMPMSAESMVAYLGIVLAGCAVVGIADSFAAAEVGTRLRIAGATLVVTQDLVLRGDKALPLYQRLVEGNAPPAVVLPAAAAEAAVPGSADWAGGASCRVALRAGDLPWAEFMQRPLPSGGFKPHVADAGDTTGVLFSSGTTGEPKAIVWTHVTPIKCGADAWAHQDVGRGDVIAWPTSMGWMMGPWLLYAALLNKAAAALFYGPPTGRPFGRFVSAARVNMLGIVPSIAKAWRASDCMRGLSWSSLRCFSSTGEASAPEDYHWLMARGGYCPVIEYCGGTEIGGGFLTGSLLQPQTPATFSTPALGTRLFLLTHSSSSSGDNSSSQGARREGDSISAHGSGECVAGELALGAPMLGVSQKLLNRDHADVYYKGMPASPIRGVWLRRHGDEVARLPGGSYAAHGRADDTMNLGGIKVSSVELERCVTAAIPGVREAAAVGVPAPGGGPERLFLFVVVDEGMGQAASPGAGSGSGAEGGGGADAAGGAEAMLQRCQAAVRQRLNPLFKVDTLLVVQALPRNASNKVMRRVLRDQLVQQQLRKAAAPAPRAKL